MYGNLDQVTSTRYSGLHANAIVSELSCLCFTVCRGRELGRQVQARTTLFRFLLVAFLSPGAYGISLDFVPRALSYHITPLRPIGVIWR